MNIESSIDTIAFDNFCRFSVENDASAPAEHSCDDMFFEFIGDGSPLVDHAMVAQLQNEVGIV
ncbi:hypothetical protein O4H61_08315 [Roseovarius aestuarii]|nr:hypothetical protein [Roseovarius aestuarii]